MSTPLNFRTRDARRRSLKMIDRAVESLESRHLLSAPVAGTPFQVNTYTTGPQLIPSIAMDPGGDFVIAWQSSGQPGETNYGIYAQRYDSDGNPVGDEIHVNTFTSSQQKAPVVAMDQNGGFVVAWQSTGQTEDTSYGIYAQRYSSTGTPQGGQLHVNTFTTGNQNAPAVAMDPNGNFVVAWTSTGQDSVGFDGVYAQRYNNAGAADGGEFLVNTYTTGSQRGAAVAMDPAGDFIVSWQSFNQADTTGSGSANDIYARRYDPTGVALDATDFLVNTYLTGNQQNPAIATDQAGNFVVTWESNLQDGANYGIYAQRFNAAGVKQDTEFKVNTTTAETQRFPAVALQQTGDPANPLGDFVITWASNLQDGSLYGIYAQRYNAAGLAQDAEFQVNVYTTGIQFNPAVAMDHNANFAITWHSNGEDGNGFGVFARRYTAQTTTGAPTLQSGTFIWQNSPQRIELKFDQDVSASLTESDVHLTNTTTATTVPTANINVAWNSSTDTATITFPGAPYNGRVDNGRFHLLINAADVTNASNVALTTDVTLDFFFVNGDANHDGIVDVSDLGILATNWQTSAQFAAGDFDYSGFVDVTDLGILATYWQFTLPAPAAAKTAASAFPGSVATSNNMTSQKRTGESTSPAIEIIG